MLTGPPHHFPVLHPHNSPPHSPAILAVLKESGPPPLGPAWMACSLSRVPGLMLDSITSLAGPCPAQVLTGFPPSRLSLIHPAPAPAFSSEPPPPPPHTHTVSLHQRL